MTDLDIKIQATFPSESVNKIPENYSVFEGKKIPSFVKDYAIRKFTDDNQNLDSAALSLWLEQHIPDNMGLLQKRIVDEKTTFRVLTRILIESDIRSGVLRFEIPEMGISKKNTEIPSWLSRKHKELKYDEVWGIFDLKLIETDGGGFQICLIDFAPFKPYRVDLEYYCEQRKEYSLEEWVDFLIRSMEYNPDGFESMTQKMLFISRMLVFVQPNLNIVELAPKGTGKSYVFSNLTKYGWVISGGTVTRAKLFYDMGRSSPGLMVRYDYVAMDEIQTIKFSNEQEVAAGLKTYLESGYFTVGKVRQESDSGFILLGNIKLDKHKNPVYMNYFAHLPSIFSESALMDRFHGFLEGWKLPRIDQDMLIRGYALNVEYFSEVLHSLRDKGRYSEVVDNMLDIPPKADTRDTKAIKKICTAYLKLLFPHVKTTRDVNVDEFRLYCLEPAKKMRGIIREQMNLIDKEYGSEVPDIRVKE